jgi:hypothetical protein
MALENNYTYDKKQLIEKIWNIELIYASHLNWLPTWTGNRLLYIWFDEFQCISYKYYMQVYTVCGMYSL